MTKKRDFKMPFLDSKPERASVAQQPKSIIEMRMEEVMQYITSGSADEYYKSKKTLGHV